MTALQILFWVFAAIAAGGLGIALLTMVGVNLPALVRTGHGLAALFALAGLFVINLLGEGSTPANAWWALGVLTAGLIGGLLFFKVLVRGKPPAGLMFGHGSVGALGVFLLYTAAFQAPGIG